MNDWLWTELHHHFDTDDGSLPEVHATFVDKQAVVTAFAQLRSRGNTTSAATFGTDSMGDEPLGGIGR